MLHFYEEELPLATIATAITAVLLALLFYLRKHSGFLPGPTGIPYLGMFPFLKNETIHYELAEYAKKYGDAYSFTITGKLLIHLGSVKAIRELHVNKAECFTDRFDDYSVLGYMLPDSVAMANGEMWKTHKKFFNQKFREYGLNALRDNLAGPMYDSLDITVKKLKERQDEAINVAQLLTERCAVTLRTIIFGVDGISDEELQAINEGYSAALEGMMGLNVILMGPAARFIFSLSPVIHRSYKHHAEFMKILGTCIKRIESSMKNEQPTCIIEEYFRERNEKRRLDDPVWKLYTDQALVSSMAQFVGDGISSVALLIAAFLNSLVEHPEEQEKIYAEIMEVVGASRQPSLEDKSKLPYTNAYLNEVIRCSSFVSVFPSQKCTREFTYRGYRIPKGAITVYNFWAVHHNPETYRDPDKFDPTRFIQTPDKPREELPVSFGMGKRSCSGEAFVMAQSFLFVTTITKNFKIVSSSDSKTSSFDDLLTGKLELRFVSRTEEH